MVDRLVEWFLSDDVGGYLLEGITPMPYIGMGYGLGTAEVRLAVHWLGRLVVCALVVVQVMFPR